MIDATTEDTDVCPFCDAELATPGEEFVDHVAESSDCADRFEDWRTNVADDIRGGWMA
jgi:hypothetical protein